MNKLSLVSLRCPYCGGNAEKTNGLAVYPHRPDLAYKIFYMCTPCDARVGCHPGTSTPLGRLANGELRKAKQEAHAAFDPMWKTGIKTRGGAYAWLKDQLNLEKNKCHIGMFDVETCYKVVEVCREYGSLL